MNDQKVYHKPVLVDEVLNYINPQPAKVYLDVTFGGGGHTRALLEKEPTCSVIAVDWDAFALETQGAELQKEFPDRLEFIWGNFAHLYKLLRKHGVEKVDGILADFGTSQYQLTQQAGFSFYNDTELDMRMSPSHQKVTAAEILNKASEDKLRDIFWTLGEERYTKQIVSAIIADRKKHPFKTTSQLASLVERVVPFNEKQRTHPATRVFQALRMFINHELENIQAFLPAALAALNPGGRLVVITFHSLEDQLVKHYFKKEEQLKKINILTPQPVSASEDELSRNPSARSAKLRAVEIV